MLDGTKSTPVFKQRRSGEMCLAWYGKELQLTHEQFMDFIEVVNEVQPIEWSWFCKEDFDIEWYGNFYGREQARTLSDRLKGSELRKKDKYMASKAIIVINGKGGIGKDTLIDALAKTDAMVFNASSIDPIKKMCSELNKENVKDLAYRSLLSKMKQAVDTYYEAENGISYTTEYLINAMTLWHTQTDIHAPEYSIMFVHIREPENIKAFIQEAAKKLCVWKDEDTILTTLLVKSERSLEIYGNSSDDDVEKFDYDYTFTSNGTVEEDSERFVEFIRDMRNHETKN